MIEEFKKYICSNCKGNCNKGIVLIEKNGEKQARCYDYEKKSELEGYVRPKTRYAKQHRSIMGFRQEY